MKYLLLLFLFLSRSFGAVFCLSSHFEGGLYQNEITWGGGFAEFLSRSPLTYLGIEDSSASFWFGDFEYLLKFDAESESSRRFSIWKSGSEALQIKNGEGEILSLSAPQSYMETPVWDTSSKFWFEGSEGTYLKVSLLSAESLPEPLLFPVAFLLLLRRNRRHPVGVDFFCQKRYL